MAEPAARVPRPALERTAIVAWCLLVLGIVGRLAFGPDPAHNNVYLKVFAAAARAFVEQRDAYGLADGGYRYPPACSALLVPFELCGPRLGSILFRLVNLGALLAGVFAAMRAGFPVALTRRERAVFWLILLGTQLGSLNNGQANSLILGLLLLATLGQLRSRDAGPALAVAASTVLKVYPFAYGMVLAVLRPRLLLWLLPACALILLLPFVVQDAAYVAAQHRALFDKLAIEDRTRDLANSYRDLRLLTVVVGVTLPARVFQALQVLGGVAIVVACLRARAVGAPTARVLHLAFGLVMCHFMLLGPATELSTYALLGPTLAWGVIAAMRQPGRWERWLWLAANGLALLAHVPVPRSVQGEWPVTRAPLPFAALLVAIALAAEAVRAGRRSASLRP